MSLHDWVAVWSSGNVPLVNVNYLAHFYLADPDPLLMVGNFMGDGVKGSDLAKFPDAVARGVRFHRFIDSYTDAHPDVMEAKRLFYPTQSKFSGVVIDVIFDHFLALDWSDLHTMDLKQFAQDCYALIGSHQDLLPMRSERFFTYMAGNDILSNYVTREGIERVFRGMDSRTQYTSQMAKSMYEADSFWAELQGYFRRFFPNLVDECQQWKSIN